MAVQDGNTIDGLMNPPYDPNNPLGLPVPPTPAGPVGLPPPPGKPAPTTPIVSATSGNAPGWNVLSPAAQAQYTATPGNTPQSYTATVAGKPNPSAPNPNSNLPSWLQTIYNNAGVTDGGLGAGFTDGAYWSDKQDQATRLMADLAGTGTDQPGPKDTGKALNSGKGASGSSGTGASSTNLGTMGDLMSTMMGPIAQGYNAFGPSGSSIPYSSNMPVPSSQPGAYPTSIPSSTTTPINVPAVPAITPSLPPNFAFPQTSGQMSSALMQQLMAQAAPKSGA